MSQLVETLFARILSHLGVAPAAGGPDAGGPDAGGPDAGGPDAGGPDAGGPAKAPAAGPVLGSPYAYTPTTWGVEETPAPRPPEPAPRRERTFDPETTVYDRPRALRRGPRRRPALEIHREPVPRGLLVS